jgi:hypothetical protein
MDSRTWPLLTPDLCLGMMLAGLAIDQFGLLGIAATAGLFAACPGRRLRVAGGLCVGRGWRSGGLAARAGAPIHSIGR